MRLNAGFTMVELIVIMIIIGIMAVAVVPRMSLLGGFSARGYADQTEAYLHYAQKSALAQRRVTRLELVDCTVANGACNAAPRYCIAAAYAAPPVCGTPCPASGCSGGWCAMSLPGQFSSPQNRVAVFNAATVCFDPLGRPSAGRIIAVSDENGALVRNVVIEAETGYVH
jgi:MSHA pilin protein MshC